MYAHSIRGAGLLVSATALFALTVSAPARADTVTDWNAIATTAIVTTAAQSPHASTLSFAMVQGAVYDAVNAIDRGHRPYLVTPRAKRSDSKEAAAATAAFRVLAALFPSQLPTLQPLYDASLAAVPDGRRERGGIAAGDAAAAAMLAARANDGRNGPFSFPIGSEPARGDRRRHLRPGPRTMGRQRAAIPRAERRDDPLRPPEPAHQHRLCGGLQRGQVSRLAYEHDPHRRSDRGRDLLAGPRAGAVEPRVQALSASHGLDIADSARLFAIENLASADGAIGCWYSKYYWNFWRPITAIREAGSDGNPATGADLAWTPLFDPATPQFGTPLVTPGFPDHPAGHGCISGAIVHTLQRFFGADKIAFSAVSNRTRTTRSYDRFSQALHEIINARVWSGIHFRTADLQGAALGKKVAHWLAKHYFQPVR